jgi:hypothetical protein
VDAELFKVWVVELFKCQFEVGCVSHRRNLLKLEPMGRGRSPFLWQISWSRLLMGDQVVGQCACHVSVLGLLFFFLIVLSEGVTTGVIDKLTCLVFLI